LQDSLPRSPAGIPAKPNAKADAEAENK
jgi:hypothetical protein